MSIKEETKRASSETPASSESLRRSKANLLIVPESTTYDPRVRMVIDFMKVNLHRKISLADYAREVNLSEDHVSRIFTRETGISTTDYLIRLRMEKAESLLTTTVLSIKQIMSLTGYINRGHFIEHFKRYFGPPPPSEYRKRFSSS